MAYRVVQWATGSLGRTCLRAVLDSPDHELVGLYVYGDQKVGRDAGDIARREPTGVVATREIEEVLDLDADVVIHTPRLQVPYELHDDDICRLLRSGKNVITTAGHHYPRTHGEARVQMFQEACEAGRSSLFGVGVSPGVIGERIAMTLASTSLDLDAISVSEFVDASGMPSPDFVFTVMGMGTDPTVTDLRDGPLPALYRSLYSETLAFMADRLGIADYTIEDDHHFEVTDHDLAIRAGIIPTGTIAATEWRWHVVAKGKRRITLEIVWAMDSSIDRYVGRPHWSLRMTGRPEVSMSIDLHNPVDSTRRTTASQYIVAGIVMQSIPTVVDAAPGVVEPSIFALNPVTVVDPQP
ncbi:hypothetical protein [Micromonospora sp. NBC_01638]|uniref:NAD(P)H-dependent amine dehydrogenase family protein n=1 Tax=Micromonospora sp. NBC_01638 TaxID=2975982 RepID=UPI003865020B|nr:hypothetical protein OG811_23920 [Micromonospora sp. NBC_01638]